MTEKTAEQGWSFRELEKAVVEKGRCGQCGGCVSFCSANRMGALELSPEGTPRYTDEERCLECGLCYLICARVQELDPEVQERFEWVPPIGKYLSVTSARATDGEILRTCTDGGVVTSLLLYLLDHHRIDGAVVSMQTEAFRREPMVATTRRDILAAAGSQFSESAHIETLGEQYSTYSAPISATMKIVTGQRLERIAVVGTPCQIHTLRKMQCLNILPSDVVRYTIGLLCMENFSFSSLGRETLESELGVAIEQIRKLNIKDDVIITLRSGQVLHAPFETVDQFARPSCLLCDDFVNPYADLSVGGLGSPDGYTSVLIRTDIGKRLYRDAGSNGYIEERQYGTYQEEQRNKEEIADKIVTFARRKRDRARRNLAEHQGDQQ